MNNTLKCKGSVTRSRMGLPARLSPLLQTSLLLLLFSLGHVGASEATDASTRNAATSGVPTADHQLFVNINATGSGDGLSWPNAFTSLQDALTLARSLAPADSVEIWVAQGVYYPDVGTGMTNNNRSHAFEFSTNIALYGGFAGDETTRNERDWEARPTVLSGDIDGNDTVDADGVAASHTDINGSNSYHVVRINEATAGTVFDGFVITSGQATGGQLVGGLFLMRFGAGVFLRNSGATLANLRIQGNVTTLVSGAGAGIYAAADSASVRMIDMSNLRIVGNASGFGGGMHVTRSQINAVGLRFQNNLATVGGALNAELASSLNFRDSEFVGNSATSGGAIHGFRDDVALVNCVITGNFASENGGGYYSAGTTTLDKQIVLTNVVVSGNRAGAAGGGIYRQQEAAGGTRLWNSILWNNQDASGTGTAAANHGGPGAERLIAVNSLVQGMNPAGQNNLDGTLPGNDPLFRQPLEPSLAPDAGGNYRLQASSPVIDQGNNLARINPFNQSLVPLQGNVLTDLDGNERIADGNNDSEAVVDLGPYEGPTFTIGGTVSGLQGTGLILSNAGEDLSISENGPFTFGRVVSDLETYDVSVTAQPSSPSQTCLVSAGSGSVNGADVTTVVVECSTLTFTVTPLAGVGGSISPDTPQSVPSQEAIDFMLEADEGYDLGMVDGNCGGTLDGVTYTTAPVEADCSVEAHFVPRTSSALSAASNLVRLGQPVTFTVEVEGIGGAPIDGRIDVSADSGESCADTGPPVITDMVAHFTCSISFNTVGGRQISAGFSASSTHSGSETESLSIAVNRYADVSVAVDDGSPYSPPGDEVAYLIELRNNGPDEAPNTQLMVAIDPALLASSWLCTALGGAQCPDIGDVDALDIRVDLPPGSGLDIIQQGTLPSSLPDGAVMQALATVSGDAPDEVIDPNLDNNSATDINFDPHGIFSNGFEVPLDGAPLQD